MYPAVCSSRSSGCNSSNVVFSSATSAGGGSLKEAFEQVRLSVRPSVCVCVCAVGCRGDVWLYDGPSDGGTSQD